MVILLSSTRPRILQLLIYKQDNRGADSFQKSLELAFYLGADVLVLDVLFYDEPAAPQVRSVVHQHVGSSFHATFYWLRVTNYADGNG